MEALQETERELKNSNMIQKGVDRLIVEQVFRPQILRISTEQAIGEMLRTEWNLDRPLRDIIIGFAVERTSIAFRICHEMDSTACLMGRIAVRDVASRTMRSMALFVHFGSADHGEPEEMTAGCLLEYDLKENVLIDMDVDEFEDDENRQHAWNVRV